MKIPQLPAEGELIVGKLLEIVEPPIGLEPTTAQITK